MGPGSHGVGLALIANLLHACNTPFDHEKEDDKCIDEKDEECIYEETQENCQELVLLR